MSEEKKVDIESLRKVLLRVKAHSHQEEIEDSDLFQEFLDAIYIIGEEGIYELVPELYDLLDVRDEMFRADVVATLGYNTRLGLSEFQLKAYDIFLNDPSEDVKFSALGSWSTYYMDSKNKDVILILYKIFIDKNNSLIIRQSAYSDIFSTVDYIKLVAMDSKCYSFSADTEEEFQAQINWNKLNKILIEYIPEVFEGNLPKIEEEPKNIREIGEDAKFIFKLVFWIANLILWPVITIYIYHLLSSNWR